MNETIVRYDGEDFIVVWDRYGDESPVIHSVLVNDSADILPLLSMTGKYWFMAAVEQDIQDARDEAAIERWELQRLNR